MDPVILDSMLRIPEHMLTSKQGRSIEKALTLSLPPTTQHGAQRNPPPLRLWKREDGYLVIPRNWPPAKDFISHDMLDDRRSRGFPIDLKFLGTFRKGQAPFRQTFLESLHEDGYGQIGQAGCGFGKTVLGTSFIAELGLTTLIVVHKEKLMKQFVKACKQFLGVTPGIVQGSSCDYKGKEICIAMAQSLYQRDYGQDFYNYWGLTITDETHRFSAPTFAAAIEKVPSKYRIGLTATPRRGDRLEEAFFWHIGGIGAVGHGEFLDCSAYLMEWVPSIDERACLWRGKPNLARMITALSREEARTAMICRLIVDATRKGRRSIVLSDRVAHLEDFCTRLQRIFKNAGEPYTVGNYGTGKTKKAIAARDIAELCTVTCGTFPMLMEGADIPDKDTIFLTTPKADVEQAVGRIRRLYEGKKQPFIIDIDDQLFFLPAMTNKRLRFYEAPGLDKGPWPVKFCGYKVTS